VKPNKIYPSHLNIGFEVLIAVVMKNSSLWDILPFSIFRVKIEPGEI
jgi:hypothetical protein